MTAPGAGAACMVSPNTDHFDYNYKSTLYPQKWPHDLAEKTQFPHWQNKGR